MFIKLMGASIASLLLLPFATFASSCNTEYQNMYVGVNINNKTNSTILCTYKNLNGGWLANYLPGAEGPNMDTLGAVACKTDSATNPDNVSATIDCYVYYQETAPNGTVRNKQGALVSVFSFHHNCTSSLNEAGGGSCFSSDYSDGASCYDPSTNSSGDNETITPENSSSSFKCTVAYSEEGSGGPSNEHQLNVDAQIADA